MQKLNSFLHKTKITKDELSQEKVDIFNRLLNINNSFDAFYKYKTMPFGWHWLFFSHFQSLQKIGEDGHTKRGDFFPLFKGCKRMFAGAEILVLDEAFINSNVTKISQITEINNKSTNDKKAFYVTVENVFKIKNKNVLIEKKKIVFIDKKYNSKKKNIDTGKNTRLVFKKNLTFNNISLFQYSALTCNSHRIHYDIDYTKKKEGYKNILVHGPLLASFAANYFCFFTNLKILGFTFKMIRPVFVNEKVFLKVLKNEINEKVFKLFIYGDKTRDLKFTASCKTL